MNDWSATKEQFYEALDFLPDGIALLDAEDRFVYWNRCYRDLYPGGGPHLKVGLRFEDFVRASLAAGDTRCEAGAEERWIADRMERHALAHSESERITADGRWIRASERRTRDGGTIGIRSDITELKQREASFRLLFDANPLPMMIFDPKTLEYLSVNAAALALYKHDIQWFATHTILDIRPERDHAEFVELVLSGGPRPGDAAQHWTHVDAEGREINVLPVARTLTWDGRRAVLICIVDMTERLRMEAQLEHARTHDPATGLANLENLRRRWPDIAAVARYRGEHLHLLRILVANVSGGDTEDEGHRAVASAIRTVVAEGDFAARLSHDEFVVLHRSGGDIGEPTELAERISSELASRVPQASGDHRPLTFVGIASMRPAQEGATKASMLREAGLALERAKADPARAIRFYEETMDFEARRRVGLRSDLVRALETDALEAHYQPVVDIASGRIHGFEALLRWRRDDGRLVPPSEFIPFAEETGLIVPIGEWVMRRACRDAVTWPSWISVAVNLSPMQFRSPTLRSMVADALTHGGLDPTRLEVEVTETLLLKDTDANGRALHALRYMGVSVALDDFGTGYSSLGYLRAFPFTKIKVDRSFVAGLGTRPECRAIVRAVAQIGGDLGMVTTAEGVETVAQLREVGDLGCVQAQGYLFSPPLPFEQATALLLRDEVRARGTGDHLGTSPAPTHEADEAACSVVFRPLRVP